MIPDTATKSNARPRRYNAKPSGFYAGDDEEDDTEYDINKENEIRKKVRHRSDIPYNTFDMLGE